MIPCQSWARLAVMTAGVAVAGGLAAGCSNSSGKGSSVSCPQPSGCSAPGPGTTQLSSPTVSFANDVYPLFQTSCATSTLCHQGINGSTVPAMSLLYLGAGTGAPASDMLLVYVALSAVASHELPSMSYVSPGDPTQSYLMHKMDGDMCQFASQCAIIPASPTACGVVMPVPCALADTQRDVVRRWIAQGATNN